MNKLLVAIVLCFMMLQHNEPFSFPLTQQEQRQVLTNYQCLLEVSHYEARGEPVEGIRAVVQVVLNRARHNKFPSGVCAVVHQRKQFSYRNHLAKGQTLQIVVKPQDIKKHTQVQQVAFEAAVGSFKPVLDGSVVFYHSNSVNKSLGWNSQSRLVVVIGSHSFYKLTNSK